MLIIAPPSQRHALKLLVLGVALTLLRLAFFKLTPDRVSLLSGPQQPIAPAIEVESCTPEAWSAGAWTRRDPPRTNKTVAASVADVLEFEGFEGCTSDREFEWHFSGLESEWPRFPEVTAFEWTPSPACRPRRFDREGLVRDLVEKGGWLLIGGKCPFFLVRDIKLCQGKRDMHGVHNSAYH